MLKPVTVLLTGCGAPGAPSIIECLRKNGEREIRIVSVDMNENAASRRSVDAFYTVPQAEDPGFIDRVLEICQKEGVRVVVPIVTRELEVFSGAKSRFEEIGVKVAVAEPGPLHIANNKGLLLTAMKEAGLPTPEFRIASTADQVLDAIGALGYPDKPVVVKPTFGNGSRGTRILDSRISRYDLFFKEKPNGVYISLSELTEILRERDAIPEMMVMEYLPGTDYTVDLIADHGTVLTSMCRKGTLVVSSIFMGSVIEQHQQSLSLAHSVTRLLELDGSVGFDMKCDKDGRSLVMEINPRLTAGVVACAVSGVNFPYLAVKRLLGEPLPACTVQEGTIMRRRNAEAFFNPDGTKIDW